MAKFGKHPDEPEGEAPLAPEPHPEVMADNTGGETVDDKISKLDKALTKRINDLRTDVTSIDNSVTKKLTTVESDIKALKTATSNNSESIRSFQASLDRVVKAENDGKKRVAGLEQQLEQLAQQHHDKNTELEKGVEAAKSRADDVATEAHNELLVAAAQLNSQINDAEKSLVEAIESVRNAPVKPHKHSITLSGESGPVTGGN